MVVATDCNVVQPHVASQLQRQERLAALIERRRNALIKRFMRKVRRTIGCWYWRNDETGDYGDFSYRGSTVKSHRMSYMLFRGPIPDELFVCHACDTPSCVRPDHLFLGTAAENTRDMMNKGRNAYVLPVPKIGSAHPQSRLTEKDVHQIKVMLSCRMPKSVIARRFGVSRQNVGKIETGETWSHVA